MVLLWGYFAPRIRTRQVLRAVRLLDARRKAAGEAAAALEPKR